MHLRGAIRAGHEREVVHVVVAGEDVAHFVGVQAADEGILLGGVAGGIAEQRVGVVAAEELLMAEHEGVAAGWLGGQG